jgi:hypothetical protein
VGLLVERIEEPAFGHGQAREVRVPGGDAVGDRPFRLAAGGDHLVGVDADARRHQLHPRDRLGDGGGVAARNAEGLLADLAQLVLL